MDAWQKVHKQDHGTFEQRVAGKHGTHVDLHVIASSDHELHNERSKFKGQVN